MRKLLLSILLLTLTTPAWAVTNWNKSIPASGDNLTAWPSAVIAQWSIVDTLLSNYRQLMPIVYKNSNTATVNAGEIVVSNSGGSLRLFLQNSSNTDITTANLDTGSSFSNSTTYYVYAGTSTNTDSSATFYISLSSSAPSGVTYYKQLGYFVTNSSGSIANIFNNDSTSYIGSTTTKNVGTIYQALTDGYVTGLLSANAVGSNGYMLGYTDSSSSPSTIMAQTSSTRPASGQADHDDIYNSITMFVQKGNYYQVVVGAFSGTAPSSSMTFTQTSN